LPFPIAALASTVHLTGMNIMSGVYGFTRVWLTLIVAAALGSCGAATLHLPSCWRAIDLNQGSAFRGTVLIFASYHTRPMMFPISCDGGVTADLPEGFTLPTVKGEPFSEAPEQRFFQADVVGIVKGVDFDRPSVQLKSIAHVRRTRPTWLRASGR
jgi:hypothetical protein